MQTHDSPSCAAVLGAGASGRAAVRALLRRGWTVALILREQEAESAKDLEAAGARLLVGNPPDSLREWASLHPGSLAVFSPGIPMDSEEMIAALEADMSIVGELALGARFFRGRMVAVTGSKGKSSVVKLLADTLSANGHSAVPCGNYGTPLCEVADQDPAPEFAIVECSSYQLQTADEHLKPEAAVLLNLSRDHLVRHGTMEAYRDAKMRIFAWQDASELAFLPKAPDYPGYGAVNPYRLASRFQDLYPTHPAEYFGVGDGVRWRYCAHKVWDRSEGVAYDVGGSYFDCDVLGPAAAAAVGILVRLGLSREAIEKGFRDFAPLPHRMQTVGAAHGVAWIDNSKATNLASLLASVAMAPKPVVLIAGGRLKEPLSLTGEELAKAGVRSAFTIGTCASDMEAAWAPAVPTKDCGTMDEAVRAALLDAAELTTGSILLAPGTESFDQFRSYAERGDSFLQSLHQHTAQS